MIKIIKASRTTMITRTILLEILSFRLDQYFEITDTFNAKKNTYAILLLYVCIQHKG